MGPGSLARPSAASLVCRRSRRQLAALNKECQFSFSVEEPGDLDLDPALAYYQLDQGADAVFPSLSVRKLCDVHGPSHWPSGTDWLLPQSPAVAPPPTMRAPPGTSSSSYRVQRGPGPLSSAPPPGNTPACSSEEEQEDASTVEDQGEGRGEELATPQLRPQLEK